MPFSTLIDWVTNIIIAKNCFVKWIKLLLSFSHLVWNFQIMDVCTSGKACVFFVTIEKWQSMCSLHHKRVILSLKLRGQGVGVHHTCHCRGKKKPHWHISEIWEEHQDAAIATWASTERTKSDAMRKGNSQRMAFGVKQGL